MEIAAATAADRATPWRYDRPEHTPHPRPKRGGMLRHRRAAGDDFDERRALHGSDERRCRDARAPAAHRARQDRDRRLALAGSRARGRCARLATAPSAAAQGLQPRTAGHRRASCTLDSRHCGQRHRARWSARRWRWTRRRRRAPRPRAVHPAQRPGRPPAWHPGTICREVTDTRRTALRRARRHADDERARHQAAGASQGIVIRGQRTNSTNQSNERRGCGTDRE